MQNHSEDFEALAKEANLPTSEAEINARFDGLKTEMDLAITNESAFGPFWRFVEAAATKAAFWLAQFVIHSVYPQSFIKTATGPALKLHAYGVKLTPKQAQKTVGSIEFTRAAGVGELIIPKGRAIQTERINGVVYSVVSTQEITFSDGQLVGLVPVEATTEGAGYNLAAGNYTVLVESVGDVISVTNLEDWIDKPGADEETDDQLRERIINQYSAINQWHTDAVYTAIIASFDGVTTDNIYFQHDAPRGPGTANAYVMLETTTPTAGFLATIQAEITDKGNHGHGDDLEVMAMPETAHDLVATLWPVMNLTDAEKSTLLQSVEDFVRCAFRENESYTATKTQPLSLFSFSQLTRELHDEFNQIENVAFDLSSIQSQLELAKLGNLTVAFND